MDADDTAEPREPPTVSRSAAPAGPAGPVAPARASSISSIPPPSWQVRRARRRRWGRSQLAIGIVVLLFFVIVGATITRERLAGITSSSSPAVFRGAYLGMTAPELRHRFAPGAAGHWAASTSQVGEEALVWTADAAGSQIAHVAFEFHDRLLVAVRAELSPAAPEASEPARTVTPVTLRVLAAATAASPGALTILARDCPTHAPEVARLLGDAK